MIEFRRPKFFMAWVFPLAMSLLMGCNRKNAASNENEIDAGFDASPAVSIETPPSPPTTQPQQTDPDDVAVPAAEALRKFETYADVDPLLSPHTDVLHKFFDGKIPASLFVQIAPLPRHRQAVLLANHTAIDHPFVMAIDANGTRAWTKDFPLAGIVPGVRDVALVRGSESAVGVAFCDSTGQRAALRMWNADGSINADFEVMEVPHCDQISAIYFPGIGHVIGSTGETTARIGMIAENGMRAWDGAGVALPWTAMHRTALTIAADTENSFVVVGVDIGEKEKKQPNDGVIMAMRYDFQGHETWPHPVTLSPRRGKTLEHLKVRVVAPRKLEVQISDKPEEYVELSSDGVVVFVK